MAASMQHTGLSGFNVLPRNPSPPSGERGESYAIAIDGPCDQARAVAQRGALDERLADALAHRAEREVAYALANNGEAQLGRKVLRRLMERAQDDPVLARALLRREDLHLCHLRLFLNADTEQRGHLIAIARRSRLATSRHGLQYVEPDLGKLARIEHHALNNDSEAFMQALAEALFCDLSMARRITEDSSGEAMALALVAIGLSHEKIARMSLAAYPEICASRPKFRAMMRIVESVPRHAAMRMIHAIIGLSTAIFS